MHRTARRNTRGTRAIIDYTNLRMELNFEYTRLEYVERDVKYLTRPFRSKSKDLKLEQLIYLVSEVYSIVSTKEKFIKLIKKSIGE